MSLPILLVKLGQGSTHPYAPRKKKKKGAPPGKKLVVLSDAPQQLLRCYMRKLFSHCPVQSRRLKEPRVITSQSLLSHLFVIRCFSVFWLPTTRKRQLFDSSSRPYTLPLFNAAQDARLACQGCRFSITLDFLSIIDANCSRQKALDSVFRAV